MPIHKIAGRSFVPSMFRHPAVLYLTDGDKLPKTAYPQPFLQSFQEKISQVAGPSAEDHPVYRPFHRLALFLGGHGGVADDVQQVDDGSLGLGDVDDRFLLLLLFCFQLGDFRFQPFFVQPVFLQRVNLRQIGVFGAL